MKAVDRFLRYIRIDTSCENDSRELPTTARQLDLANLLVDELGQLGLQDITLEKRHRYGNPPANVESHPTGDGLYRAYGYHPGYARQVPEPKHH